MRFDRELSVAIEASAEAAAAIKLCYGQDAEVRYKSPEEPVTEADMVADRLLRELIGSVFPDDGWLSEESVDSGERLQKSRVWIVDPLDGTREFVAGRPEFAVSVGLIEDGLPVVGVIANPISGHIWSAQKGGGAFCDGEPIHVRSTQSLEQSRVLVSRSETRRGMMEKWADVLPLSPMGGAAHKLVLIASGQADATFTQCRRCEWDLAAGVLILEEAGGRITRPNGVPFTFNREAPFFTSGHVASNGGLHDALLEVLRASD